MRELYALVFSVCVVLIGTEMIVRLFPEKSGSLIPVSYTHLTLPTKA